VWGLKAVVDTLRLAKRVGRVAVWGRSMGATTAMMYASTRDRPAVWLSYATSL
jgi:pimeloyl-ACP methyl ester carboxylesterase